MPASQSLPIVLRGRLAKILAMFRVQHLTHAIRSCPNFYNVTLALAFHRDELLVLDSSPNLSNDLRLKIYAIFEHQKHCKQHFILQKNEKQNSKYNQRQSNGLISRCELFLAERDKLEKTDKWWNVDFPCGLNIHTLFHLHSRVLIYQNRNEYWNKIVAQTYCHVSIEASAIKRICNRRKNPISWMDFGTQIKSEIKQ